MAEEDREGRDDSFTSPHLPERYHQHIRAKRQRRLMRRLFLAGSGVLFIIVLFLLLGGPGLTFLSPVTPSSPPVIPQGTALPGSGLTQQPTLPAVTPSTSPTATASTTSPRLPPEKAREIADRYISDRNGGQLPLNMTQSGYEPNTGKGTAGGGHYIFMYERVFQDYPTDVDGFRVEVDGATGEVIGYTRKWTTQEYAFSSATVPDISRQEATFAVLQKAKEQYYGNIEGLRIISAELRWKNDLPEGTVSRPGSIPLAWKVIFDDEIIRANATATPAVAWIDVQTGDLLSFAYHH